jgi:hypothetical protein
MKYINKTIASETAFNMLKSTRDKIENKNNELLEMATDLALKSIPENVNVILKNIPDEWIEKRTQFYFHSGVQNRYFNTKRTPSKIGGTRIEISNLEMDKLMKIQDEIYSMSKKRDQIKEQIVATLLKLRTPEKIKKEFPEAFKCFPKDIINDSKAIISFPIEKILTSINDFPE